MTANAITAKSEALELHELSSEELDAVAGGSPQSQSGGRGPMGTLNQIMQMVQQMQTGG